VKTHSNQKTWIVLVLALIGLWAVAADSPRTNAPCCSLPALLSPTGAPPAIVTNPARLPRLVDLGAGKCIPCRQMVPILEKLRTNNVGRLEVEVIDVSKAPEAAKAFRIELIPTQIFFDSTGREIFRHEGFFSEQDILAKWKELGVELGNKQSK
jgi:thioredoxin 1